MPCFYILDIEQGKQKKQKFLGEKSLRILESALFSKEGIRTAHIN